MMRSIILAFLLALFGHNALAELPEVKMTVPQIIEYYNYPVQTFDVTCEDGYILTLHR